jgi:predicted RNA-binding Zn-ribbon protein involved in translation (DUF1610 family)
MAKKHKPQPSLLEFQKRFPDDRSCAEFLFERRWPEGFVCPKCDKGRAALLRSRAWTYECLDCGRQTSVTAGTVMHRTKLRLAVWFWAAHLMATHSNGMSALQLRGQLGISYRAAWLLTQKLRRSMVDPGREPLEGVVEIDQTEMPFRDTQSHYDPAASGKILVIGAVEIYDHTRKARQKPLKIGAKYLDTRSGRIRLQVISSNAAEHVEAFVRANIKPGTTLLSDGHKSYVFRYNRRFYRHVSFETILRLAAAATPISRWEIVGRTNPRIGRPIKRLNARRRRTAIGMRQDTVKVLPPPDEAEIPF